MKWVKWRVPFWLAGAIAAAGLLVASAGGETVSYGVSASKGCLSPAFVGQPYFCFYIFSNTGATSGDTVKVFSAEDVVSAASGTVPSGNILSSLKLVFTPSPGSPGAPTCTGPGSSGVGTLASPFVGATQCTLPFGANVASLPFSFYTIQPADFGLPGHGLSDQITFTWSDLCDKTPSPGSCNPVDENDAQAPSSTAVKQYNPTITTQLSASTIPVGGSVHDTAAITYDTAPPASPVVSGTVTYKVYTDNTCTTLSTTPAVNQTVAYTRPPGTVPDSSTFTFTQAGNYWFQATFSGDPAHGVAGPVSSPCTSEPLVVTPNPAVATLVVPAGPIQTGSSAHDTATLLNVTANAGGTISYKLYSDSICQSSIADLTPSSATVVNGTVPPSKDFTFNTAGTFYFVATYSGDAHNVGPVSSGCTAEPIVVNSPPPPPPPGTPAISITKNPKSQTIAQGGTANFTIVVTNTGDIGLVNVSVADPLAPGCNRTSADIPALASMAPGASVTYNCSLANVQSNFTNVATATGTGTNGQTVTAQDTAPVTVTVPVTPPKPPVTPPKPPVTPSVPPTPKIDIIKDPNSQTIAQGATATFKITVTNTGEVTLSDVTVTDPLSPDCDRHLGTLAVGQSKSYSCSRKNVNAAFENVATATGKPPTGARVQAKDNANVKVQPFVPPQHPKIAIVKSPKQQTVTTKLETSTAADGTKKTTVTYGDAHFTIKVTNTGDVTLHSVKVADPQAQDCIKSLGTLAPGKSKTYDCTRSTVSSNFRNIATATGISPKGKKVQASDHANVTVKVKTTSTSGAKFTG
jgi:uncharacterized repeat protein (TIGR01451 family)